MFATLPSHIMEGSYTVDIRRLFNDNNKLRALLKNLLLNAKQLISISKR